jgi:hypothetical protein
MRGALDLYNRLPLWQQEVYEKVGYTECQREYVCYSRILPDS